MSHNPVECRFIRFIRDLLDISQFHQDHFSVTVSYLDYSKKKMSKNLPELNYFVTFL